jgi:carboxymethylenebutenolidase
MAIAEAMAHRSRKLLLRGCGLVVRSRRPTSVTVRSVLRTGAAEGKARRNETIVAGQLGFLDLVARLGLATMGTRIEFSTPSGTAQGYLAQGAEGAPGVVVIQEWWGLVPQIEATCDRFAAAGLTALAPDLYGGTQVPLDEPDAAGQAMMELRVDEAAADLSGAVDELVVRTGRRSVGVVGYCMGGGLALVLAAKRPDAVSAVVPCYGVHPWADGHPDYSSMTAAVQIHCAGLDTSFTPQAAEQLAGELAGQGLEVEYHLYDGVNHAFANEDRPEVYDELAATTMFDRTVAFLGAHG